MKITSIKGQNLHIPRHGEPQNLGVVLEAGLGQDTDTHARLKKKKKNFCFNIVYLAVPGIRCHIWDLDLVPRPAIEPRAPAWATQSLSYWTTREVPRLKFEVWNFKVSGRCLLVLFVLAVL